MLTLKHRGEETIHGVGATRPTCYHKILTLTIRKSKTKATDRNGVTPVLVVVTATMQELLPDAYAPKVDVAA
jgi:hypothetical protein